jgi:hypothetical protein
MATMARASTYGFNARKENEFGPDGMKRTELGEFLPDGELNEYKGRFTYGPDGMKVEEDDPDEQVQIGPDGMVQVAISGEKHHGVEVGNDGTWFKAENIMHEEEARAQTRFKLICDCVDNFHKTGRCYEGRWTNDPAVFPDDLFPGVEPFPPNDAQLHVPAGYGQKLHHEAQSSHWTRLVDYGPSGGFGSSVCNVFDELHSDATNCGRVFQGMLDNAYFIEVLNAISLRPLLARRLFHAYDVERSVFVVRLFRNGTWVSVEVDDYVPTDTSDESAAAMDSGLPFCCRSEYFPSVLWPSLVEKAYAKTCTLRFPGGEGPEGEHESGGWEAIGRGGRVEDALVDLTGGVAGHFSTQDVAPDRLFIYLYELQRYCLFVCRTHQANCIKYGVPLNPFSHYAINRAAHVEGGCYVQLFVVNERGHNNGGLEQLSIPDSLIALYPEKSQDGFMWMNLYDFYQYFDKIFECRLTNSPDVGIRGMPPPKLPNALKPSFENQPIFFEHLFANDGLVTTHNPPEFSVSLPEKPCEIVISVDQVDHRLEQLGSYRKPYVAILLKVYEEKDKGSYNSTIVCKSDWMPLRGSMVCFRCSTGGKFKIIAEMQDGLDKRCERLIFRCYSSIGAGVSVMAGTSVVKHNLVFGGRLQACKWTFVGCVPPEKLVRVDEPLPLDEDIDAMRQRQQQQEDCTVM